LFVFTGQRLVEIIENYVGKGRVTYRGKYVSGNQWNFSVASLHYTFNLLDIIMPSKFCSKDSKFLGPDVHPSVGIIFCGKTEFGKFDFLTLT
jgi:hypothetical protein